MPPTTTAPKHPLCVRLLVGFLLVSGLAFAGCTTTPTAETTTFERRQVPAEVWERIAICYSGYREGQSPQTGVMPSDEQVREDLNMLVAHGFGLIRTYSSLGHGAQVVRLIALHNLDLKVQVGAYLSGAKAEHGESNSREIEGAIALANAYPDIVMGVSVGNEVLVSWSFVPVPLEELIAYLTYVRDRIEQPLTVNDNWEPYAVATDDPIHQVWQHLDYASVHTYAYWDAGYDLWPFRQTEIATDERPEAVMNAAVAYTKANYRAVREALDAGGLDIPIVIGETGWQSSPSAVLAGAPSQDFATLLAGAEAQRTYFRAMLDWVYGPDTENRGENTDRPKALFYFSAFDEPWKEADDNWGLWDAQRNPKPAITEGLGLKEE